MDDEKMTFAEKLEALCGKYRPFTLRYVDRFTWERTAGKSHWDADAYHWEVVDSHPSYVHGSDIHERPEENVRAFVEFGNVARGPDQADQSDIYQLSNYRSLLRDFRDELVEVSFANVDLLGAFVGNMSPRLVRIMVGLVEQYTLYDESDESDLEVEMQQESWTSFHRSDLRSELISNAVSDEAMEDLLDEMDDSDAHANTCYGPREQEERDTLREIFHDAWSDSEDWGHAERSSWIFPDVTEDLTERLWDWRCAGLPNSPAWVNPDQLVLTYGV